MWLLLQIEPQWVSMSKLVTHKLKLLAENKKVTSPVTS